MTIVYRRSPNLPEQFFIDCLHHYGFKGIAANDGFQAFAAMMDAVRHNRVVFAMMDDTARQAEAGVTLRFLGKNLPMPGGMVQLARQTRAPIVPITSLAVDPAWHFRIEPQLQVLPGGTIEDDMTSVLGHFERQILAHPEMWSWPHRRWSRYPVAAVEQAGSQGNPAGIP
jgi:lauroyl/myristoyl acyltransferase